VLPQEIIRQKRDGGVLAPEAIVAAVAGIADGSWSEGQIAALAMAIFLRGMDRSESVALTQAMTRSGRVLDWRGAKLPGPVIDKHSTGGVGDKISLMLAPLLAACGAYVPMLSGRGLGHTGGTLDKLESIPGLRTDLDPAGLSRIVAEIGCAIVGAGADIAPADRALYAVRDVTATVESIPLIVASILSKKLAAGIGALVMDVKTGSGAFAAEMAMARELAEGLVEVATGAGLPIVALITDMDQPLGRAAGNALEVGEAVDFLRGRAEPRLREITLALAGEALALGGLAATAEQGRKRAMDAFAGGKPLEIFGRMVAAQGGPKDFVERMDSYLPRAGAIRPCTVPRAGFVAAVDTRRIGLAVVEMGGGRRRAGDRIDPAVGLSDIRPAGTRLAAGEPYCFVHAADEAGAERAAAEIGAAVTLADRPPAPRPAIHRRIPAG